MEVYRKQNHFLVFNLLMRGNLGVNGCFIRHHPLACDQTIMQFKMGDPQDGYRGIRWRSISTAPAVAAAKSPAHCHPDRPIILLANDEMMRLETSVRQRGRYAGKHIAYWFAAVA